MRATADSIHADRLGVVQEPSPIRATGGGPSSAVAANDLVQTIANATDVDTDGRTIRVDVSIIHHPWKCAYCDQSEWAHGLTSLAFRGGLTIVRSTGGRPRRQHYFIAVVRLKVTV